MKHNDLFVLSFIYILLFVVKTMHSLANLISGV